MCVKDFDLLKTDQFKAVSGNLSIVSGCLAQEYEAGILPKHRIKSHC